MGVQDGFPVSASYTNPRFISKNTPDVMPFPLGFTGSGTAIANIQTAVNKLYNATGASESTTGTVYNATPGTVSNGDTYEDSITILANKFDAATGHKHTGANGDAPVLDVVLTAAVSGTGGTPVFGNITFESGVGMEIVQTGNNFSFNSAVGTTIAASGYSPLSGAVTLVAGTGGISISQSGQNIIFEAGGGGGGGNLTVDTFSGDNSTTIFTLSVSPGSINNCSVYISGVYQNKAGYSVVGTALTFSTAPPTGTNNIQVVSGTTLSVNTPAAGSVSYSSLAAGVFVQPTVQKFTTGSGTYTLPSSPRAPLYIRVRAVGAGGGGSGSGTASQGNGGAGTATTFGTGPLIGCNGGQGGTGNNNTGGAGGTVSLDPSVSGIPMPGQAGTGTTFIAGSGIYFAGALGGSSFFGGGGAGTKFLAGGDAVTNSGSGGAGGGTDGTTNQYSGNGGGAGGYADAIITSPASTYPYQVGAAGAAGTAGTSGYAGGAGSNGYIEVTEYYQ